MRPAVVAVLAGLLVSACSLVGLYDSEGGCRFAPMGPPRENVSAPLTLYNNSGQRVGTVLPSPSGAVLYTRSGARVGIVK